MAYVMIPGFLYKRCGRLWIRKQPDLPGPEVCAKCKSPYWNRQRQHPIGPNVNPLRNDWTSGGNRPEGRWRSELAANRPSGGRPVTAGPSNIVRWLALTLGLGLTALALAALACGPSAPSEQSEDPTPTPEPTATATAEPTAPSESKLEGVDPLLQAWYWQDEHKRAVAAAAGQAAPTVRVRILVVNAEALPDLEAFLTDHGATEVVSGEGKGMVKTDATVPMDLIPELAAQPGAQKIHQTRTRPYENLDYALNIYALKYETGLLPTKEEGVIGITVFPKEGTTFAETRASFL